MLIDTTDVTQSYAFAPLVTDFMLNCERLLEVSYGLRIAPLIRIHGTNVVEDLAFIGMVTNFTYNLE